MYNDNVQIAKGQIWQYQSPPFVSEQWDDGELIGDRPVIVYQYVNYTESNRVVVIPFTSLKGNTDKVNGIIVTIDGVKAIANVHRIKDVSMNTLTEYKGLLSADKMAELNEAVSVFFGLNNNPLLINKYFPIKHSHDSLEIKRVKFNKPKKYIYDNVDVDELLHKLNVLCRYTSKSKINFMLMQHTELVTMSEMKAETIASIHNVGIDTATKYKEKSLDILDICKSQHIMKLFAHGKVKDTRDEYKFIFIKMNPYMLAKYIHTNVGIIYRYLPIFKSELMKKY